MHNHNLHPTSAMGVSYFTATNFLLEISFFELNIHVHVFLPYFHMKQIFEEITCQSSKIYMYLKQKVLIIDSKWLKSTTNLVRKL